MDLIRSTAFAAWPVWAALGVTLLMWWWERPRLDRFEAAAQREKVDAARGCVLCLCGTVVVLAVLTLLLVVIL